MCQQTPCCIEMTFSVMMDRLRLQSPLFASRANWIRAALTNEISAILERSLAFLSPIVSPCPYGEVLQASYHFWIIRKGKNLLYSRNNPHATPSPMLSTQSQ